LLPLVKRSIGPGFSWGYGHAADGRASRCGPQSENIRRRWWFLGAVLVFAGVAYGVNALVRALKAPLSITVDGQPFSLSKAKYSCFSTIRVPALRRRCTPYGQAELEE